MKSPCQHFRYDFPKTQAGRFLPMPLPLSRHALAGAAFRFGVSEGG